MEPRELAPNLILIKEGIHNFTAIGQKGIRHVYKHVTSSVILYFGVETIVIDAGSRMYRREIEEKLEKYINPDRLRLFIATHYHHDHIDNSDLFPHADRILDYGRVTPDGIMTSYNDASFIDCPPDIQIFATPGHVKNHIAVKIVIDGIRYVCAGDAIRYDVLNMTHQPDYLTDEYISSARRIFEEADFIIPGHGKPFAVDMDNLPPLIENMP
jgi:glyoxylase-like metal-dependent hydrolase (beta-lactamase superfamily II)